MTARVAGLLLLAGCGSEAPRDIVLPRGIVLAPGLREVSGLASASSDSVFAHDDEQAVVYEIQLATGRALRRFALGDPPIRGDFEGIAAADGRIFLITSDGQILSAPVGADGAQVPFARHDTGAGATCEIEGLSLSPSPGRLLILCKHIRDGRRGGRLLIFEWAVDGTAPARVWRDIDLPTPGGGRRRFTPSSIEWAPSLRQLVVISSADRTLLILDETGRIIGERRLAAADHPQPEGAAVTDADALVIADEGQAGAAGRLTVYPPDYLRQVPSRFDETASESRISSKKRER